MTRNRHQGRRHRVSSRVPLRILKVSILNIRRGARRISQKGHRSQNHSFRLRQQQVRNTRPIRLFLKFISIRLKRRIFMTKSRCRRRRATRRNRISRQRRSRSRIQLNRQRSIKGGIRSFLGRLRNRNRRARKRTRMSKNRRPTQDMRYIFSGTFR